MTRRVERVAEELREEVARIVEFDLKDPGLGFVTITRVSVTPDLRFARVYVGVLGDEAVRRRGLAALGRAAGFVRREVGRRLRLRCTPELVFEYDTGLDATDRVARLLDEVRPASEANAEEQDEPKE
jgi:ribosome-binding factor A